VAACAAVVQSLRADLRVTDAALARGIEQARLPARMESRQLDGVEWIFDVAHNPAAARALAEDLTSRFKPARTIAVFAAMADKDVAGVIDPLIAVIDEWIVTRADPERGAPEKLLLDLLLERHARNARARSLVSEACRVARDLAVAGDRVLVFGSCYMVGPAMEAVGLYCAPSTPDDRSSIWTGA
jgi:dihydrofolate synthase/folylpolyglutamate synthase